MELLNNITIRAFESKDTAETARIQTGAFGSKFGRFYKSDPGKLEKMFFKVLSSDLNQGYLVAEQEGKILGFISLCTKKLDAKKSHLKILQFMKEFGFLDTMKFLFIYLFVLEIRFLKKDECYIAEVAVAEEGRGKGIGSQLLISGEEHARTFSGIKRCTLYVMTENEGAHKLYLRKGYIDVREDKTPFTKGITGYSGAFFMEKEL